MSDIEFLNSVSDPIVNDLPHGLDSDQYLRLALSAADEGGVSVEAQIAIAALLGFDR